MTKRILLTLDETQVDELSKNHVQYVVAQGKLISLQEYIRRILEKENNRLDVIE